MRGQHLRDWCPINAIANLKFYDEIDAINFTGQTFQSERNRHVLLQIEIKCLNTSNIGQQDADNARNLDKIIANMRQSQAIYQTKADKLYADTSLITNMFQSTIGRIAMASVTIINIASVVLGIFTFFKVRKLAILWAFNLFVYHYGISEYPINEQTSWKCHDSISGKPI